MPALRALGAATGGRPARAEVARDARAAGSRLHRTALRALGRLGASATLAAGCTLHAVDEQPRPLVAPPPGYPSLPPAAAAGTSREDAGPPPDAARGDDAAPRAGDSGPGAAAPSAAAGTPAPWWRELGDPVLDALVARALEGGFDVEEALARLLAARARAAQAGAPLRPFVDAFASRGVQAATSGSLGDLDEQRLDVTEAGLAASWELDLFGRLRSLRAAARTDAEVAAEDVDAVRLLLSAEVADAYLLALEQRLLLLLLDSQLRLDRTLLELTELRFAQGGASAVDVLQQQSQVADTESRVPPARAALRVAENRLDVLSGRAPDGEDVALADDFPALPPLPPVGVPADLLLRRPDLRAALLLVTGADHRLAAAVADRFPRLLLNGSLAWRDIEGDSGYSAALFADLLAPLVDGGLRRAIVHESEALLRERVASLTGLFLRAVEEVDNALWQEQRQREELAVLQRRERILQDNVAEARNRYANGLTDYLPVLVAVDQVQEVQRDLVQRRRALLSQRVALHRALGGALPPWPGDGGLAGTAAGGEALHGSAGE